MTRSLKMPDDARAILVRVPNWIGDAVMCLPALHALLARFPCARVDVLSRAKLAPLFRLVPGLGRCIVSDENPGLGGLLSLCRTLRAERYDIGLVLNNSFRAAALMRLAAPRLTFGYATEGRSFLLSRALPYDGKFARHQAEDYNELVRALGTEVAEMDSGEPLFAVGKAERDWADALIRKSFADESLPLVGVNPGASYGAAKCWPQERFAAMLEALGRRHRFNTVLFGGPAEKDVSARVKDMLGAAQVLDMGGRTNLPQLLALIERCEFVASNDTGPMHLAAAMRRRVLAFFGSTLPGRSRPFGENNVIIWKQPDCSPCFKRVCPLGGERNMRCMTGITVEEAVDAASGLMEGRGGK